MKTIKEWFNQRLFNAGIYCHLFKLDFPPKGWTAFFFRIAAISVIVVSFRLGVTYA